MTNTRPIIVGGLHGSGAEFLPDLLNQHPEVGLMTDRSLETPPQATVDGGERKQNGGVTLHPGQALQSIYEHEDYFGGPGAFAFHPDAALNPTDDQWSQRDFDTLHDEWNAAWPRDATVGVEYSPANVLRADFLAEAFPDAVHVYLHRHPILDALRTQSKTDDRSQSLESLVRHWIVAHQQLIRDIEELDNCIVVSFDELRRRPDEILDEIFEAAGLDPISVDPSELRSVGRDRWIGWKERPAEKQAPIYELEDQIRKFGYDLDHPDFEGAMNADAIRGAGLLSSGVDTDTLRPDTIEITDRSPPATVPQRILVISFGTRSAIEPSLAAAKGFREEGYDITVLSTAEHQELADATGVQFESIETQERFTIPTPDGDDKEQLEAYLEQMYRFYDDHGTELIRTLSEEIDHFDCVFLGQGIFFRGLLAYHFQMPLVELEESPTHLEQPDTAGKRSVETYAETIIKHAYASASFKIGETLDRAYEANSIEYRHTHEGFSEALIRSQSTRILRGPSTEVAPNEIPGLPDTATGFWQTAAIQNDVPLAADVSEFLDAADEPVCIDLAKTASSGPEAPAWMDDLLASLTDANHECVIVGNEALPRDTTDIQQVPPAQAHRVYQRCEFVVHDGSPRSTVGCLDTRTPALVVPPVSWDRGPTWARWIENEGAGVHARNPEDAAELDALIEEVSQPQYENGVQELASRIDLETGVSEMVEAFEQLFGSPDASLTRDWQMMVYINSLEMASWRKTELLSYALLRESTATPGETLELRDTFVDAIDTARRTYPVYKSDWPHKGEPLDLAEHDLPHESSGTEWWYYHTHLETESGSELSLFSVLFKRLIDDGQYGHGHAGVLEVEDGIHKQRSIGDPTAPEDIAPKLAEAPEDAYGQRALREVYEQGEYPAPDQKAEAPPSIPATAVDFELGDMTIEKDDGDYLVGLEPDADREFGFSLRFSPEKAPVLHYPDGVMKGVTSQADMFYYSITRMNVTGHIVLDGDRERVTGSGWYDHEFGGGKGSDTALGGAHSWLWMGIQLDDGSELGYTTVTNQDADTRLHDDAILYVSPDGGETYYEGEIEELDTWSSMYTYIEYGTAWRLTVPALDLDLEIEAVEDRQEMRSVIARPSYWEGRIDISGTRNGDPISGTGICEQYGQGGDRSNYREFLEDVSREVQRSVRDILPYDMTEDELRPLVASDEFPELVEGVDPEIFVESGVRPVRTMVERGGKGWRSMALLIAAEAAGEDPHELQRYLAFPELIHTGSLIIDDIEDNSTQRRGGPAAHEMFGEPIAINAGTSAYFMGERLHEEMDFSDEQLLRMYQLHMQALRGAHTGQAMDIYGLEHKVPRCLETGDFTPIWENVKATHRLKSAVPAMIAARIGAVAADADRETEDILGEYFLALGYAFQLVDDAINLRGFEHDLKEHAEDLLEGKITAPIARAFMVLDDRDRRALWEHLQADPDEMDIKAILSLVERCGAVDWCHDRAREVVEEAWEPVDEHLPDSQTKMRLRAFGWFVVDVRDY